MLKKMLAVMICTLAVTLGSQFKTAFADIYIFSEHSVDYYVTNATMHVERNAFYGNIVRSKTLNVYLTGVKDGKKVTSLYYQFFYDGMRTTLLKVEKDSRPVEGNFVSDDIVQKVYDAGMAYAN